MIATRKTVLAAAAVLVFSVQASAADKVTLALGWTPTGSNAYFYMAKDGGFFAAENLDVQIQSGRGASEAMTKVATGAADFGEAGLDALLTANLSTELPLKAVMPIYTIPPDALITTTTSGIKSLKDLAGKTVATTPFTQSNGPWPFILELNGVQPASVQLLKGDPAAMVPMLATGKVDAVIQFTTNAPTTAAILTAAGKTIHVLPWSEFGMSGYSNSVIVSNSTLASRRDVVVRFTRALLKGIEAEKASPARAAKAIQVSVPEIDVDLTEKMINLAVPLIFNESTEKAGLGKWSPEVVAATWEWVAKAQGAPLNKLDPMKFVDTTITQ